MSRLLVYVLFSLLFISLTLITFLDARSLTITKTLAGSNQVSMTVNSSYKPISIDSPLVRADAVYVESEINKQSSKKKMQKIVTIRKAEILLNQYIRLNFDLGLTVCEKSSVKASTECPIDSSQPIVNCKGVIISNTPFREVKYKITTYGNCQP